MANWDRNEDAVVDGAEVAGVGIGGVAEEIGVDCGGELVVEAYGGQEGVEEAVARNQYTEVGEGPFLELVGLPFPLDSDAIDDMEVPAEGWARYYKVVVELNSQGHVCL